MNFPEEIQNNRINEQLRKGEAVTVVGASQRRGHLLVESNGKQFEAKSNCIMVCVNAFFLLQA